VRSLKWDTYTAAMLQIPTGGLSLHNGTEHSYVDVSTGSTMSEIVDMNNVGIDEIIALYGQANESIRSYSAIRG